MAMDINMDMNININMEIYQVGGSVRDALLNKIHSLNLESNDIDYVVINQTPHSMLQAGFQRVGKDFPVFLHPETKEEYALARTEKSTGNSYQDFEVNTSNVTLEQDLQRRDLTINSIAMHPITKDIIDPFHGHVDIQKKLLRHTSDAFFEDPVRVLRLARFRTMLPDWKVDYELKAKIYQNRDMLSALQPDRVWKEVDKALDLPNFHIFFETLFELGVLDIIFPHIHSLTQLKEGSKFHREASVFEHTMMMSKHLAASPQELVSKRLKLAVLFHDIAKPDTYRLYGSSAGHDNRSLVESKIIDTFKYAMPKKLREDVVFLIANHIKIYKLVEMKKSKVIDFLIQYTKKQYLIEEQSSLALLDDIGRITDEASRPKLIPDSKSITQVIEKLSNISMKPYMEKNPKATKEQIQNHLHQLRAREVSQFYTSLRLMKG